MSIFISLSLLLWPLLLLNHLCAVEAVSIESLLNDMVDRDAVARFPQTDFRLKQASSYNRASKAPEEPKGWFNNKDFAVENTFIRTEMNQGRKEWVLMDHQQPGAIVRSWMPDKGQSVKATIRIYLDGSDTPAIEGHMIKLFNGEGLIPYPFAHPSLASAVSFFPIPYAKSCKVTIDGDHFFNIFTYREYPEGTPIKTFSLEDFEAAKPLIEKVGKKLLAPQNRVSGQEVAISGSLGANEEKSVDLPSGVAAVRSLSLKLGSYADPEVTRKVVLKIEFDGRTTVWCPIGEFFGSGIGLHPFQGWYRTVAEDGTMLCRWVMPYQQGGKITVINYQDAPVEVELSAVVGDWEWDADSLYFHAGWRGQYPLPTRPYSDWNYITTEGRGVYVGDTLTLMNPVDAWWGEGDEKIYVDGEDFPSLFGTGTEDYYAYSWGGKNTDFYEHPFHAQVMSHKFNKLNRKPKKSPKSTRGYSVETRTRALDAMPFGNSLKLDMEVWHWADCELGYGVGAYWYGDAATTSNLAPDVEEVRNVPPLPDMNQAPPKKKKGQKDPDEVS